MTLTQGTLHREEDREVTVTQQAFRRQRSSSRETLCRVRTTTAANLFHEEPDMFESIKLTPQKTFMWTTAPKVRLIRMKEKNKRQKAQKTKLHLNRTR